MEQGDQLNWYILQHIAENVHCISCHRSYAPEELHILAHQDGLWFVRVSCDRCGTEGLIVVTMEKRPSRPSRRSALPVPEDQTSERRPARPITESEIAELRRFLETYHGNLSEWLGEQSVD